MILRPAGQSPALLPSHPPKLSRQAMTAIGLSLIFHAGVGAYLYTHRFTVMALPTPAPIPTGSVIHWPPDPAPSTPQKTQSKREQTQDQSHVRETPIFLGGETPRETLNFDPPPTPPKIDTSTT